MEHDIARRVEGRAGKSTAALRRRIAAMTSEVTVRVKNACAFLVSPGIFQPMKAILLTLSLLTIFTITSRALDIVTPERTFKDVKVSKVVGEAVSITHSEGTALVDFDLLPPAMQAEYGWTPEKSAARKAAIEAAKKKEEDEEKMIAEAPKRKAMEEVARNKAEEDKLADEERAKRKVENAAFEAESATAQQDLLAAAAKARAELDRERKGIKGVVEEVPVAEIISEKPVDVKEAPAVVRKPIAPGIGSVSDAIVTQNPLLQNPKVWIGFIVALIITVILFMLPSNKTKLTVKVQRRR